MQEAQQLGLLHCPQSCVSIRGLICVRFPPARHQWKAVPGSANHGRRWLGWVAQWFPGGLCFTYLRPELAHVLTSVGTCPFAASVSALVQT